MLTLALTVYQDGSRYDVLATATPTCWVLTDLALNDSPIEGPLVLPRGVTDAVLFALACSRSHPSRYMTEEAEEAMKQAQYGAMPLRPKVGPEEVDPGMAATSDADLRAKEWHAARLDAWAAQHVRGQNIPTHPSTR